MGRKKMKTAEKAEKTDERIDIRLRVDGDLHQRIQAAADQESNSVAAFIRTAVVEKLKRIEGGLMAGPTTESIVNDVKLLRQDLHAVETSLKDQIHGVDRHLAAISGEFRAFKWMLGLTLALAISTLGGGIWWGGHIDARVGGLEARFDKLESRIDARFDKLEASIAKAIEQARSPASKPGP